MIRKDKTDEMRMYMSASEKYSENLSLDRDMVVESDSDENDDLDFSPLRVDLLDLVERLRMFNESSGGDYAFGFEAGMQRAAEMIENILDEYRKL